MVSFAIMSRAGDSSMRADVVSMSELVSVVEDSSLLMGADFEIVMVANDDDDGGGGI